VNERSTLFLGTRDPSGGRIHDDDARAGDALEDDEVVHVPVQDRRQGELAERLDADLDAARGEADALGQVAQLEQRLAAAARAPRAGGSRPGPVRRRNRR
jgi:hypothetical protein